MNRLKAALPTFGSTSTNSTDSNVQEEEDRLTPCPISRDRVNLIESNQLVVRQIHSSLLPFYKGVAKTRSNPLRQGLDIKLKAEERFSCEWLGDTLNKCSEDIQAINGHDSEYSSTLALVGDAHLELGNLTKSYADSLQQGLIATLEEKLEDFKQFEKLLARADKKRNQLQGIMNKLEKGNSKKDTRSELEHELDQAEWTYRDACDQLTRKADELEQQATPSIVEALQGVIDAQLDFATNYTNMLTSIRTRLPPVSISSVSHSTSPTRSRSSTLQSPPSLSSATRMNRSLSESSAPQNVPTQFLSNSILSSLGPGRTRSQTVVEEMKDKEKESKDNKEVKNRSRSGSMLERFALVGKKKRDKALAAEEKEDENGVEGERNGEKEDNNNRSRSNSASGSARGGGGGGWATPSLPSLGSGSSFSKKPSTSSSYGYGSLRDSDEHHPSSPTTTTTTTPFDFSSSSSPSNLAATVGNPASPSSSSTSKTRRFVPPLLKRTQTAPASTSSTSSSPSSPSGRFNLTQPSSPLKSTFSSSISSSTKTPKNLEDQIRVRARWPYSPNVRDQDELEFEKGDFVRVSKVVNTDWWIGTNETSGESGMFPSAYVVVVVPQEPEREEEEDRYGRSDSDHAEEEEEGRRRRLSIDDRDSLRSSTTTTSTRSFRDSDDDEENEFLQPTRSSKPFSSSTTSSTPYNPSSPSSTPRPAAPLPPRPPTMTRNGSTTPRKPPPPPPPARWTNSGGHLLLNGRSSKKEKEVEGSPFD